MKYKKYNNRKKKSFPSEIAVIFFVKLFFFVFFSKLLDNFSKFDLKSPMPGCGPSSLREIIDSGPLKLKESTRTIDVHSFLFTDMLLITTIKKDRKGKKRFKIIRPPIPTNRCVVAELKDDKAFVVIQLNDYNVTEAVYMFVTNQYKKWIDKIKDAQVSVRCDM
jgi:hypothetical protein